MRVLIIEDDKSMAQDLKDMLSSAGHDSEMVHDGAAGLSAVLADPYDVLIVDRMLPEKDGLTLVREIREMGSQVPALFLTALDQTEQRVEGLKAGGDDYLGKPFEEPELLARVEALARRGSQEAPVTKLVAGELEMDLLTRKVTRGGKRIDLQPREFRLLEYLMRNAGQVVTRTMLLQNVWNYHFDPQTNVIDVHVSRLRAKIDKDFDEPLLHTVRGSGYKLQG